MAVSEVAVQLRAHLQRSIGRQISLDEASTLTVGKLKTLESAARRAAQDTLTAQQQDDQINEGVGVPTGQFDIPELEPLEEVTEPLKDQQDAVEAKADDNMPLPNGHQLHLQVISASRYSVSCDGMHFLPIREN